MLARQPQIRDLVPINERAFVRYKRLQRVEDHLYRNPDRLVRRDDAARKARMAPDSFSRFFKDKVGVPYVRYRAKRKMEKALRRMTSGNPGVEELALDLGYEDARSFTRAFKRIWGVTPRQAKVIIEQEGESALPASLRPGQPFRELRSFYRKMLSVPDPWRVRDVHLDEDSGDIIVDVRLRRSRTLQLHCPECDAPAADHDVETRSWRYLDTCQFGTVVNVENPRVWCSIHGLHHVEIPWVNRTQFTLLFSSHT